MDLTTANDLIWKHDLAFSSLEKKWEQYKVVAESSLGKIKRQGELLQSFEPDEKSARRFEFRFCGVHWFVRFRYETEGMLPNKDGGRIDYGIVTENDASPQKSIRKTLSTLTFDTMGNLEGQYGIHEDREALYVHFNKVAELLPKAIEASNPTS